MGVYINLSNESKMFMSLLVCSVIVLTAYTQTNLFVTDPRAGVQSTRITLLSRRATNSSKAAGNLNYTNERESGKLLKDVYIPGFENSMSKLCSASGSNVTLLIVITSEPSHANSRMAIRNTWGLFHCREDVVVAFIVGSHPDPVVTRLLAEESALYNDVITNRNFDSYRNLTLKTTSILEWVRTFCLDALYVLKTDDDVFVNTPKLLEFIKNLPKTGRNIYGNLASKWLPHRNQQSKYYVSKTDFNGTIFPNFTTGPAYLMRTEVVTVLYEAALETMYLPLEDVFFTGVVAERVGVQRVATPSFSHSLFTQRLKSCKLRDTLTFHKVDVLGQFAIWARFNDTQDTTC